MKMSNFAVTLVRWHRHSVVRKLGVMNKVNTMSPPANRIWFRKSSYKMCLNSGAWFVYMLHAPRLKTVPDFIMQSWIRSRVKPNQFHQFVASTEVLCNRTQREHSMSLSSWKNPLNSHFTYSTTGWGLFSVCLIRRSIKFCLRFSSQV